MGVDAATGSAAVFWIEAELGSQSSATDASDPLAGLTQQRQAASVVPDVVEAISDPDLVESNPDPGLVEANSDPDIFEANPDPGLIEDNQDPGLAQPNPDPDQVVRQIYGPCLEPGSSPGFRSDPCLSPEPQRGEVQAVLSGTFVLERVLPVPGSQNKTLFRNLPITT
jgi:hypothetical protein